MLQIAAKCNELAASEHRQRLDKEAIFQCLSAQGNSLAHQKLWKTRLLDKCAIHVQSFVMQRLI
jgi:3-deoxy-D-arabino-heptulosonate 7-phosphate (DAHP) synthase class II